MTDKQIKTAVVGVGSLGQHHARVYADLPGADLVGVYDKDGQRAAAIAEKHGTAVLPSLDAVAEKAEAASIAVPTDIHRGVAGALIESGLHLLVEKPIAATTAEAEELVSLATDKNVILQVGHIERFNPVLGFLEDAGHAPRFIEAHRLAPYPKADGRGRPRGTEVSVILDLMIHDLEIIGHLVQSPVRQINAVGVPVLSRSEDIANVRLSFENGCVANVTASRISPEKMRKIRVFRDDAYISLDYMNQAGEIYRKGLTGIKRKEIPVEKEEPLVLELSSFVDCVARRGTPVVSGEQAAEALKLAVEIIHRLQQGPS